MTHLDHLYRVAVHLAKDADRAQDLDHETFVRALDAADRFSQRTNMKGWLTKILYNLFIDQYRQSKRWTALEPETQNSSGELSDLPADSPGAGAVREISGRTVLIAVYRGPNLSLLCYTS